MSFINDIPSKCERPVWLIIICIFSHCKLTAYHYFDWSFRIRWKPSNNSDCCPFNSISFSYMLWFLQMFRVDGFIAAEILNSKMQQNCSQIACYSHDHEWWSLMMGNQNWEYQICTVLNPITTGGLPSLYIDLK